jgi:hypothetical protein
MSRRPRLLAWMLMFTLLLAGASPMAGMLHDHADGMPQMALDGDTPAAECLQTMQCPLGAWHDVAFPPRLFTLSAVDSGWPRPAGVDHPSWIQGPTPPPPRSF